LQSAGTTAVTIDTSQNVGIGTTSPSGRLHVTATAGSQTDAYFGNQTAGARTNIRVQSASNSDGYVFFERSGASENGYIRYSQASDFMSFQTASAERMRIDSSGYVRINNTSNATFAAQLNIYSPSTNNCAIHCRTNTSGAQSQIIFGNSTNDSVGGIVTTASATAYNTSSDYRLKENIVPMTGALATVAQLKPVTYKWKSDGSGGQGFIAHELQSVVPECVTGEKDATREQEYEVTPAVKDEQGNITTSAVMGTRTVPAYQGIDTSFLVATLTAAIQVQQATINALTARIVALEAK
jgi:hypothetical protein